VIVVSDSSPLISLARVRQLKLRRDLYSRVMIPFEVYEEVTAAGSGLPGSEEVRRAGWIEVKEERSMTNSSLETACLQLGGENAEPFCSQASLAPT
jgi:uncharacterized protein